MKEFFICSLQKKTEGKIDLTPAPPRLFASPRSRRRRRACDSLPHHPAHIAWPARPFWPQCPRCLPVPAPHPSTRPPATLRAPPAPSRQLNTDTSWQSGIPPYGASMLDPSVWVAVSRTPYPWLRWLVTQTSTVFHMCLWKCLNEVTNVMHGLMNHQGLMDIDGIFQYTRGKQMCAYHCDGSCDPNLFCREIPKSLCSTSGLRVTAGQPTPASVHCVEDDHDTLLPASMLGHLPAFRIHSDPRFLFK